MPEVSEKKSPETFQTEKTISRREALKRIALGVPMIVTLPSCGGNRQNIQSASSRAPKDLRKGFTGIQYVLLESNLIDLKKQGIEERLIKKLQPLQGKWFPREQFAVKIEKLIGKADFEAYFPIIINVAHHKRFNKGEECGRYLSCGGITYTGDCCDDRIERYTSYTSSTILNYTSRYKSLIRYPSYNSLT
jgi:hypothetical protein